MPMAQHRNLREHLVVGRLCTPSPRKWPSQTIVFYERLAGRFPRIQWEFVGCPEPMKSDLLQACRGRAEFVEAGWSARSRLWNWDALLFHHPHLTESFGRTCAESMRAGCVPIVNRRGGFVEQVTPETGFLCSSEAEFALALAQLHNAGFRRRMARSAMAHADRAFSLQRFRSDLLSLLRTVASITR
jgi:glycosyltransferase involved in cell wall biosynthesis